MQAVFSGGAQVRPLNGAGVCFGFIKSGVT
jgi:hypothetical protein